MKSGSFTSAPGWWAVVNIDQRGSRTSPDLVPGLLEALSGVASPLVPERTLGDEVQLLTTSPATLAHVLETTSRSRDWRVGIGFGPVEEPLPNHVREGRGPAFIAARSAIDTAHNSPSDLAFAAAPGPVTGSGYANGDADALVRRAQRVTEAEAIAGLLHYLWSRRTKEGWDVVDALRTSGSGRATAEALGISPSAVSQRLRTAGWQPGEQGRDLLEAVLAEVLLPVEPPGEGR